MFTAAVQSMPIFTSTHEKTVNNFGSPISVVCDKENIKVCWLLEVALHFLINTAKIWPLVQIKKKEIYFQKLESI